MFRVLTTVNLHLPTLVPFVTHPTSEARKFTPHPTPPQPPVGGPYGTSRGELSEAGSWRALLAREGRARAGCPAGACGCGVCKGHRGGRPGSVAAGRAEPGCSSSCCLVLFLEEKANICVFINSYL